MLSTPIVLHTLRIDMLNGCCLLFSFFGWVSTKQTVSWKHLSRTMGSATQNAVSMNAIVTRWCQMFSLSQKACSLTWPTTNTKVSESKWLFVVVRQFVTRVQNPEFDHNSRIHPADVFFRFSSVNESTVVKVYDFRWLPCSSWIFCFRYGLKQLLPLLSTAILQLGLAQSSGLESAHVSWKTRKKIGSRSCPSFCLRPYRQVPFVWFVVEGFDKSYSHFVLGTPFS